MTPEATRLVEANIKLAQKCVEALCVPIRAPYKISGACRHHKNGEHGEGGIAP